MFYEKINQIYNTSFVFGSNDKIGIRKIYESSIKQLKINAITKWLILFFGTINGLAEILLVDKNLTNEIFQGVRKGYKNASYWFLITAVFSFWIDIFMIFIIYKSSERYQ